MTHIFREQNGVADGLAKIALRKSCDWIEFNGPPVEVQSLFEEDFSGSLDAICTTVSGH